jgi:hypothetical protein
LRIANEEILDLPETAIAAVSELPAANRVLIDETTRDLLAKTHHCESFPEITTRRVWASRRFFELVSPVISRRGGWHTQRADVASRRDSAEGALRLK